MTEKNVSLHWADDSSQLTQVAADLAKQTREHLMATAAGGPGLFPHGITHVRIELSASVDSGARIVLEVDGPDAPSVPPHLSRPTITPYQLTPTAVWWFNYGTETTATIKVASLGSVLPPPPSPTKFSWVAKHEHWLIDQGVTDIFAKLGTKSLSVSRNFYKEDDPDSMPTDIQGELLDLGKDSNWRYQGITKGYLDQADWTKDAPVIDNSSLCKFYQQDPVSNDSPALLLEMTTDKKNFHRVTWLSKERQSGFPSTFTLKPTTLPTEWKGYWRYSADNVFIANDAPPQRPGAGPRRKTSR